MYQNGLFKGRTRVRYGYSCYGKTRGNGTVWHYGSDEEGIDSDEILVPSYKGKTIQGTVITARIVTDHSNLTWEWGYYICIKLDANQTPDPVNYLYFCHCEKLLVKAGDRVKTGDVIAIMGNTGNAALANPPFAHCHFEVRATSTGAGLDPTAYTGHPNSAGTYGTNDEKNKDEVTTSKKQTITIGPVTQGDADKILALCKTLGLTDQGLYTSKWA